MVFLFQVLRHHSALGMMSIAGYILASQHYSPRPRTLVWKLSGLWITWLDWSLWTAAGTGQSAEYHCTAALTLISATAPHCSVTDPQLAGSYSSLWSSSKTREARSELCARGHACVRGRLGLDIRGLETHKLVVSESLLNDTDDTPLTVFGRVWLRCVTGSWLSQDQLLVL